MLKAIFILAFLGALIACIPGFRKVGESILGLSILAFGLFIAGMIIEVIPS